MTIDIHISGASAAEIRTQIEQLLGGKTMIMLPREDGNVSRDGDMITDEVAAAGAITIRPQGAEAAPKKRTRAKKAEPALEADKTMPDADEDDDADAQADDADEAIDAENGKLTHDDVRAALARYMKKFGIGPTQLDGPKVLAMIFGDGCTKASDVPDDQASIGKAVAGIEEMLAKNPFKRTAV